jgi:DNA-binding MarR family transcriptional regulator
MSSESHDLLGAVGEASRAMQASVDAVDEAAARLLGINRTDLRCLDELLRLGEAAPARLAERLRLTTGSMTTLLDRLERGGYVTRSPDTHDRRKVIVRPTDLTWQRAKEIYGPIAAEGERALAELSSEQLRAVLRYLELSRDLQERHANRLRRRDISDRRRGSVEKNADAPG